MSLAISRAKYTGDPGLFGDIFSGVGRFIKGGVRGITGSIPPTVAGPGSVPSFFNPENGAVRTPGMRGMAERFFPGGASGYECPADLSGYHLNKSDYFLMSGEFVPAGSRYVKNRKRNPANARATSRAISRISGAKRYAKSLSRISIRKKS